MANNALELEAVRDDEGKAKHLHSATPNVWGSALLLKPSRKPLVTTAELICFARQLKNFPNKNGGLLIDYPLPHPAVLECIRMGCSNFQFECKWIAVSTGDGWIDRVWVSKHWAVDFDFTGEVGNAYVEGFKFTPAYPTIIQQAVSEVKAAATRENANKAIAGTKKVFGKGIELGKFLGHKTGGLLVSIGNMMGAETKTQPTAQPVAPLEPELSATSAPCQAPPTAETKKDPAKLRAELGV